MPSFNDFSLQPTTLAALAKMNITEPSPVQAEAIPALLAGKDLVGRSATGSGKTLAFSIPLVERLAKKLRAPQALILVPTRELALQVHNVLSELGSNKRLLTALLVGGRAYSAQFAALRNGAQIIVGTPGRVKDHLERGTLVLSQLRMCVLDEADQMLDIGFAPVIEEILTTTPETRQMALFSATMPEWVTTLQEKFLKDPVKVDIVLDNNVPDTIEQIAYQVPKDQKMAALCTLLQSTEGESSLVFGKTKFGVEKLGKQLSKMGFAVETLHGDKSQNAREKVLTAFRRGQVHTLLATNVAARGLDIQGIHQVINYELPESSELFTHRAGRTGRMGRQGKAITLLVPADVPKWRRMSRTMGQNVALQRLTINAEAMPTSPAELEDAVDQRREQPARRETRDNLNGQKYASKREMPVQEPEVDLPGKKHGPQRPFRESRDFSQGQKRGRAARPEYESPKAARPQRQSRERFIDEAPSWEPEDFPAFEDRPYAAKAWGDDRRATRRQSDFGRGSRPAPRSFATPTQPRTARRRPMAGPVGRKAAGKRAFSR